ncbi:MAG: aldehyde ferredoxin oxidoreductase family protein [Candidatus Atabeyarchaeum deiterrae]
MEKGGFWQKLLRVDLTSKTIKVEDLSQDLLTKFGGGSAFSAKMLYDEVPAAVDPLGPKNRIYIMTGALTGTAAPCCGRHTVVSKSPLTGIFGESSSGGFWGAELKWTGFDGIAIQGVSEKPTYLFVHDEKAELKDASKLWGKDTFETEDAIKKELNDPKIKVASIGPAGEKLVKIACIINDKHRAAGRCGMGAVMGSKKLKAIAVRGTRKVPIANPEKFKEVTDKARELIDNHLLTVSLFKPHGNCGWLDTYHEVGDVPIKYWQKGYWPEGAEKLAASVITNKYLKHPQPCYGCPIGCARYIEVNEGPYAPIKGGNPEYEGMASFGTLLMNDNIESVFKAHELCNRYGIDIISAGASIGFAMTLYEKGIINNKDTGGLEIKWGDPKVILQLIEDMAFRKGFGNVLADDVREAAKKIGKGSEQYAVHTKGMSVPMHDPRAFFSLAAAYATSTRGAYHFDAFPLAPEIGIIFPDVGVMKRLDRHKDEGKGDLNVKMQNLMHAASATVMCAYAGVGFLPSLIAAATVAATGVDLKMPELVKIGERAVNVKRAFSVRCGVKRDDSDYPKLLTQPLAEGGTQGKVPNLKIQLDDYYRIRGWTPEGKPTKQKLIELGLDSIAKDLWT